MVREEFSIGLIMIFPGRGDQQARRKLSRRKAQRRSGISLAGERSKSKPPPKAIRACRDGLTPTRLKLRKILVGCDKGLRQGARRLVARLEFRGVPGHAGQVGVTLVKLHVELVDDAVIALVGSQEGGNQLGSRLAAGQRRQISGLALRVGGADPTRRDTRP